MPIGKGKVAAQVVIGGRPVHPLRQGDADGKCRVVLALAVFFDKNPDIGRTERREARGLAVSLVWLIAPVRLAAVQPLGVDRQRWGALMAKVLILARTDGADGLVHQVSTGGKNNCVGEIRVATLIFSAPHISGTAPYVFIASKIGRNQTKLASWSRSGLNSAESPASLTQRVLLSVKVSVKVVAS